MELELKEMDTASDILAFAPRGNLMEKAQNVVVVGGCGHVGLPTAGRG
jgi:hypothetical protein